MTQLGLIVTDAPGREAVEAIGRQLEAAVAADVGSSGRRPLAVLIHGDDDAADAPPLGGLSGYTAWGWLFVQWLVVPEALRGRGWAGRLLDAAEAEAIARSCRGAWIDTFNPVARRVYEAKGYRVFGELPDFPEGRTRVFLRKTLG